MADNRISCHVSATELVTTQPGWRTYGASSDLTGSEREDFEAALPFAGPLQEIPDCPWLGGVGPVAVLRPENYTRLRFAFGEKSGKLAFSIWGRIQDSHRSSPPWRVMTLTLLFDQNSFRLISGNPEALLARILERGGRRDVSPSRWFERVSKELFQDIVVLPPPRSHQSPRFPLNRSGWPASAGWRDCSLPLSAAGQPCANS